MRGALLGVVLLVGCSFRPTGGTSDAPVTPDGSAARADGPLADGPLDGPLAIDGHAIDGAPDAPEPADWWDKHWARRSPIEFVNTNVTSDLARFPVLVTLTGSNFDYSESGGSDLRFVSADGSDIVYASEVDTFVANGTSQIWVLVPAIAAMPAPHTTFWMYFDNPSPAASAAGLKIWADYVSVHHLSGTADATLTGHDGSAGPNTLPSEVAGLIGSAASFSGNNEAMQLGKPADYSLTTFTIGIWINTPPFSQPFQCLVCKGDNAWRLQRNNTQRDGDFGTNDTGANDTDGNTTLDDNHWHYVVATYDGATTHKTLYVDGAIDGSGNPNKTLNQDGTAVEIGNDTEQASRFYGGLADELRVTSQLRPPAWIETEYQMVAGATALGGAQPIVLVGSAEAL